MSEPSEEPPWRPKRITRHEWEIAECPSDRMGQKTLFRCSQCGAEILMQWSGPAPPPDAVYLFGVDEDCDVALVDKVMGS